MLILIFLVLAISAASLAAGNSLRGTRSRGCQGQFRLYEPYVRPQRQMPLLSWCSQKRP